MLFDVGYSDQILPALAIPDAASRMGRVPGESNSERPHRSEPKPRP